MTCAAMAIADMKVWAQRSYRVWMRRQSLSLPKHVLDFVALFVEHGVMGDGDFPVGF